LQIARLGLSVIILLGGACSSRSTSSTHQFRQYVENGIQISETTGGPKYDSDLFRYDVDCVIPPSSIEETILEQPFKFSSDEDGNLYISDWGKGAVLVYHPDGRYSHTIGRKGYGPGEFQQPRIQEVRNGEVTLIDNSRRRLFTYTVSGRYIDEIVPPRVPTVPRTAWYTNTYYTLDDGSHVHLFFNRDPSRLRYTMQQCALFTSPEGDTIAAITTPWVDEGFTYEAMITTSAGVRIAPSPYQYPFGPEPACVFNSHVGVVICSGIEPVYRVYLPDGELGQEVRVVQDPQIVTNSMQQHVKDTILSIYRAQSEEISQADQNKVDSLQFPETVAFCSKIEIEDNGYIWVRVPQYPRGVASDLNTTWRVFSPEGEYLGCTVRPKGILANDRSIYNGRLLIMRSDSITGEWLPTVYRVVPVHEGLPYPN